MNNKLFDYIGFLLSTHNCVVIPGLGAFVLNQGKSCLTDLGAWTVPEYTVAFNSDLKHDDGLLATFVSSLDSVSYNVALRRIKDSAKNIRKQLQLDGIVHCGNLGSLTLAKEGRILFAVNKAYSNPKSYGLSVLRIERLEDIVYSEDVVEKHFSVGRVAGAVAAAAAAFLLIFMPSASVRDFTDSNVQQAGFAKAITQTNADFLARYEHYTYYVVLGGEETREEAEKRLVEMEETVSLPLEIIESGDRYRISAASFVDESQAEDYLVNFRTANPDFKNAWIYSVVLDQ